MRQKLRMTDQMVEDSTGSRWGNTEALTTHWGAPGCAFLVQVAKTLDLAAGIVEKYTRRWSDMHILLGLARGVQDVD